MPKDNHHTYSFARKDARTKDRFLKNVMGVSRPLSCEPNASSHINAIRLRKTSDGIRMSIACKNNQLDVVRYIQSECKNASPADIHVGLESKGSNVWVDIKNSDGFLAELPTSIKN